MTNEEAINVLKAKMDGSVDTSYEWAETVRMAIKALKQPEPNYDEWCETCSEYDSERHCCPRFNHVIRETVQEMRGGQDEDD